MPEHQTKEPTMTDLQIPHSLASRFLAMALAVLLTFTAGPGLTACGQTDDAATQEASQQADNADDSVEDQEGEESDSEGDSAGKDGKDDDNDKSSSSSSSASGESGATSSESGSSSKASTSSSSKSSASSSKSTSGSASKSSSASGGPTASKPKPSSSGSQSTKIKVTMLVDASNAADSGYAATFFNDTLSLKAGSSVYDALVATGLSFSGSSTYVSGINGLAEKQLGKTSGWMYEVNGAVPMTTCGKYLLKDGDYVRWYYVTSYSDN